MHSSITDPLTKRLLRARHILRPPPKMGLIEWADTYRYVAGLTSATPGKWQTKVQPAAFGPMAAITDGETHTITVMAGTQILKTELLIDVCGYYAHQDPSPILFVRPSQGDAQAFSKERLAPTIECTPVLRQIIAPPRAHDSTNTIAIKNYPGGSLAMVGANSPTDLSSRPRRIVVFDELDKAPPSAGSEGSPLALAEERASTYHNIGRAKFVRACSPTVTDISPIEREYKASDQRKLFISCPHCAEGLTLNWSHVAWDRDAQNNHLPNTAHIVCSECGAHWSEQERLAAIDAIEFAPGYGWRQTKQFTCCDIEQTPERWDGAGHSLCSICNHRSPFDGHAGFLVSKLYSKRHSLADMAKEFLAAQKDRELLRKFFNTCLSETFGDAEGEILDGSSLINRREPYGPNNLPAEVLTVTAFCDVQDNSLHVLCVGWGTDEESWPFLYRIIDLSPTLPQSWNELETVLRSEFTTVDGRKLRIMAAGCDTGGHHAAEVFSFCRKHRGRRLYPCKGVAGKRVLFGARAKRTKVAGDVAWLIGVDTAKDTIYSRLKIPPSDTKRQAGFIHFPDAVEFNEDFFAELTVERRETRKMRGQPYVLWVLPSGRRNEALDVMVGNLCIRRSLPRRVERKLEYPLLPPPEAPPSRAPAPEPQTFQLAIGHSAPPPPPKLSAVPPGRVVAPAPPPPSGPGIRVTHAPPRPPQSLQTPQSDNSRDVRARRIAKLLAR